MKVLKAVAFLAMIAFSAWALWEMRSPRSQAIVAIPTPQCSPQALPSSYSVLNGSLREFDDALVLAVNVPREQIVSQVERLQAVRRAVENEQVPACMQSFKTHLLAYMNRVLDLLVAFVGGAAPDTVMRGLMDSNQLREPVYADMATLTGATVTPQPTMPPLPEATESSGVSIPVTGGPQALAFVGNSDGVNLREGPGVLYNFAVVLPPGTQLAVLGSDASRQWLLVADANGQQGWVFLPLVELNVPVDSLPVVE